MLIWKSKTAFENPSYRVFLDSGERFTNESTGESTPHAEKVATSYERMNLLDKVGKNLPDRTTLTMSEYTVESTDTKGVLRILQNNLDGSHRLKEPNFLRLSYDHMYKQNRQINLIETGDKVSVSNGVLTIFRHPRSRFNKLEVTIYPWTATAPAIIAPKLPGAPAAGMPVQFF
ncbi:MAG: hypothetical protein WC653_00915 [Candidatus Gracilibacteria bacterium]